MVFKVVPVFDNTSHLVSITQVAVDLNQLAQDCCPNLNVEEEMKKQMLASPPHSPKHRFRSVGCHSGR